MTRSIPATGINLFQSIYLLVREYQEKTGLPAMNLSLGNPDTVPVSALLELQSRFARDPGFDYHTYGEDNDLHGFAAAMVELHSGVKVAEHPHLRVLPIPGIKTATAVVPLACAPHLGARRREGFRLVSNLPAYDVVGTWGAAYLGVERLVWPLSSSENMRLTLPGLKAALRAGKARRADLVFVIRPGNPGAVGASVEEWKALIEHCIEHGTRLVNDGAYAGVAGERHVPLAAVAKDYPELEWLELYSVSKSFSDPGARLGALVGSKDFVEDFVMIKGNTESGPVPYVMAAYGTFFEDRAAAKAAMEKLRLMYERRLEYVIPRLEAAGLRPACRTEAGFFTLWKVPKRAFGAALAEDPRTQGMNPHQAFNRLVIDETGIVGVHFEGPLVDGEREAFIRYAVCTDVLDPKFQARFEEQLARMRPEY